MSALEPVAIEPDMIRRITRDEYRAFERTGMFEDERVELLYGQLVAMPPADASHDRSVTQLARMLILRLGERADVRVQCSFAASETSEPLPDVVVAPMHMLSWTDHPGEAQLVVEVARTSLRKDRGVKRRLYGEVAVGEYWIVDIEGGCVHVLRDSDGHGNWRSHRIAQRGEMLTIVAYPNVTIAVDDIVPPLA